MAAETTAALEQIVLARAQAAETLTPTAKELGAMGRKALLDAWTGEQSIPDYYAGFAACYQAGLTGKAKSQVRGPYAGYVNEAQRSAAYDAGQQDAAASLAKEKAAAPYARTAGDEAGLYDAGDMDADTASRMDAAAKLFGVRVLMVDNVAEGRANGQYSGSDILIAKDAADPVALVFGHELGHRMQELAPEQYRVFRQAALDNLADSATLAKIDNYRAQGMTIQYEAAMDDVTADYAGQLLEDGAVLDEFIERHRTDRTLLQKLRDAFRSLWQKLTGAERRKAQTAEGKLATALDAAAEQTGKLTETGLGEEGEVRYSIKYDRNNTPYVVVETDILKGVPQSEWARTVKDNLRKKFPNGITVGNNVVRITRKSWGELTRSKYTMQLSRENPQMHSDKLRATDSTDEIIQAAQSWVNEAPLHPRNDDIIDFARGTVQIRIGGNDYTADVVVGNRGRDGLLLYDIIDLLPTQIQERTEKTGAADTAAPSALEGQHDRQTAPIEDTIPQSGEESKSQYSLKDATITKSHNQQLKENDALREHDTSQEEADRRAQEAAEEEAMDVAIQALAEQYGVEVDAREPSGPDMDSGEVLLYQAAMEAAEREDSALLQNLPPALVQMAQEMATETTAALEQIVLARAQAAETLAPTAKELGAMGRKALLDAWTGEQSIPDYYAGFAACYQAGLTGKDMAQVRSPYARTLSDVQRQAAYLAGEWDAAVLARGGAATADEVIPGTVTSLHPGDDSGIIETPTVPSAKPVHNGDVAIKIKNANLKNGLPISGQPGSIVDKIDDAGKVLQRRIYGADGKAAVDFDTSDHGNSSAHPTGAHKHVFDWSKKNPHGRPLPLTEQDLSDNDDIIQRGVNYHDPQ